MGAETSSLDQISRIKGAVAGVIIAIPPLFVWLLHEGGMDSNLERAFLFFPIVGLFVGILGITDSSVRRSLFAGAVIGFSGLAIVYSTSSYIRFDELVGWPILGAVFWGAWGIVIGGLLNLPRPIKDWLLSFLRLGYGIIPVRDGTWLKQPVPSGYGNFIISSSLLWPIGRLRVIPNNLQPEFFRRMRKTLRAKNILKIVLATLGLLPLFSHITRAKYDSDLVAMLFVLAALLGTIIPLNIFISRTRRLIRSNTLEIKATRDLSLRFFLFNITVVLFAFVYGFLKEIVPSGHSSKSSGQMEDPLKDLAEDTVQGFFQNPQNPILAFIISLFKAAIGLVVVLVSTLLSLFIGVVFVDASKESLILVYSVIPLLFAGSFLLSYWYFIRVEHRYQTR